MKEIRAILFPTDFSAVANSAFPLAVRLAQGFGATVHALHVTDGGDPHITESSRCEFPSLPAGADVRVEEAVVQQTKDPADIIMDEAHSRECDVIVMASHGRSEVAQFFLGRSVAERVARDSRTPTVIARLHGPRRTSRPVDRFANVVYATDLQEHTTGILPVASAIARQTGAKVRALLVFDEGDVRPADGGRGALERFFTRAEASDLLSSIESVRGGVGEAVVEYASANQVDLIAITTAICCGGDEDRTDTAEHIIRSAPCPVLCVRTELKR
ncbi:MAG TPA: universal stress protein [Pyrinomonadaceae bacterium]|jgi:nucleotide-binding universal stress UspA family protein